MRYVAAADLPFTHPSGRAEDPQEVCPAGTELEMVPTTQLTAEEADGLARRTDRKRSALPSDARVVPFRWLGRVRFLQVGVHVRLDGGGSIPEGVRRVQRR